MGDKLDNQVPAPIPVGRPLRFKTVGELEFAVQLYFDQQDPHIETHMVATGVSANGETMFQERKVLTEQKPYTLSGLARALGVDRGTVLNYSKREEFFSTIQAAKDRCAEYAESQLFSPYANGAKFALTNNYGTPDAPWADKQVLAGDPNAPLANPYAALTSEELRKLAEAEQPSQDEPDGADV